MACPGQETEYFQQSPPFPLPDHAMAMTYCLRDVLPDPGVRGVLWSRSEPTGEMILHIGSGDTQWHYGLPRDLPALREAVTAQRWGPNTTAWVHRFLPSWIPPMQKET